MVPKCFIEQQDRKDSKDILVSKTLSQSFSGVFLKSD